MPMSKQDENRNATAAAGRSADIWLDGHSFFETRQMREEKASKCKAVLSHAMSAHANNAEERRLRIKAANDRRAAVLIEAETAAYKAAFEGDEVLTKESRTVVGKPSPSQIDRNNPNTWKRPNLDKLKASILADWKGDIAAFA